MKSEKRKSIEINDVVKIQDDMMFKGAEGFNLKRKYYVIQWISLCIAVFSSLFCFISGFRLECNPIIILLVISVESIGCIYLFHKKGAAKKVFPVAITGYLLVIILNITILKNGFLNVLYQITYEINDYYGTRIWIPYELVGEENIKIYTTVFFIFIAVAYNFLIGYLMVYAHGKVKYLIATLPLVISSIAVGIVPGHMYFILYVISTFSVFAFVKNKISVISSQSDHMKNVISIKAQGILGIILVSIYLIAYFIFPPRLYDDKINVVDTKKEIQEAMIHLGTTYFSSSNPLFYVDANKANGGLNGGLLGSIDKIEYKDKTDLQVILPVRAEELETESQEEVKDNSKIYLKGYVGSTYKRNHWEDADISDYEGSAVYNAVVNNPDYFNFFTGNLLLIGQMAELKFKTSLGFDSLYMQVNNIDANNNYRYVPYNTILDLELETQLTEEYVQNGYNYVPYSLENDYSEMFGLLQRELKPIGSLLNEDGDYYLETSESETKSIYDYVKEYIRKEKEYRDFAYDVYTRLPSGMDQLVDLCGNVTYEHKLTEGIENNGINSTVEMVQETNINTIVNNVRSILNQNTKYSLSPGKLPRKKDFVNYFLFENKKGYCAHYASAATLLFRAMGVPARYVEGYVILPRDIEKATPIDEYHMSRYNLVQLDLKDSNAHAWVEIYLDGYGWIPIETTPSYYTPLNNSTTNQVENNQTNENLDAEKEKLKKEQEKKALEQKKKKEESKKPVATKNNKSTDLKNNTFFYQLFHGSTSIPTEVIIGIRGALVVAIILGIVVLILGIRYIYEKRRRKKILESKSNKKKILSTYKEINKLLEYYNLSMNDQEDYKAYAKRVSDSLPEIEEKQFVSILELVHKAKFSNKFIYDMELLTVLDFYKTLVQDIYNRVSKNKQIYLKYIKLIQ